jgi:hypothetical protein
MRTAIITAKCAMVLAVACITVGVYWAYVIWPGGQADPQVVFPDGYFYDFGSVGEGESVTHEFRIQNVGGMPLEIADIVSGCACSHVDITNKKIEPGDWATITMRYTGRPVSTHEVAEAVVVTNDPNRPYVRIAMSGYVNLSVFWSPRNMTFYGERMAVVRPKSLDMVLRPNIKLEMLGVEASKSFIRVTQREGNELGFSVALSDETPHGPHAESVRIKMSVDDVVREIIVPVYAFITD